LFFGGTPPRHHVRAYSVLRKAIKKSKLCSQLGALLDALDLKHCQVRDSNAPGPASAAKQEATVADFCNGGICL